MANDSDPIAEIMRGLSPAERARMIRKLEQMVQPSHPGVGRVFSKMQADIERRRQLLAQTDCKQSFEEVMKICSGPHHWDPEKKMYISDGAS